MPRPASSTPAEAIDAIVALAAGDMDEALFTEWIRAHLR
jgi:prophage maintenance system killer protein